MRPRKYLSLIKYPLDLMRTKKVLQVNPTVQTFRKDAELTKVCVYDYDKNSLSEKYYNSPSETYSYRETPNVSWINIDGLRKKMSTICAAILMFTLSSRKIF